jgi:hypothetical protein
MGEGRVGVEITALTGDIRVRMNRQRARTIPIEPNGAVQFDPLPRYRWVNFSSMRRLRR